MSTVHPARHLLRAKDLADARYSDPLDVPALARAAHVSPAHFSREFKRAFGSPRSRPSSRTGSTPAFRDPSGNSFRMAQRR
ncbi:MAG TPA: hypothetical protein VMT59_07520 [Gaiellaceae bacterium]|nr:hypothetical protein [Gaiellaceae bacterium]